MVQLPSYAHKPPAPQPPLKKSPPWALIGIGAGVLGVSFCCVAGALVGLGVWLTVPGGAGDAAGGSQAAAEQVAKQEMVELGVEPSTKRGELATAPADWKVSLDEPWPGVPAWNAKVLPDQTLFRIKLAGRDVSEAAIIYGKYEAPADAAAAEPQPGVLVPEGPPGTKKTFFWVRVATDTGESIGDPVVLWPNVLAPGTTQDIPAYTTVHSALTLDGSRLAIVHPVDLKTVLVKSKEGETVWEGKPYGDAAVDFVGWSPEGNLLTIGQGKLIGTKVPGGEKVFELGDGYTAHVQISPRYRTLVVVGSKSIDAIDTSTGAILGRLALPERLVGNVGFLALSEDGKQLAVARRYVEAPFVAPAWDRPDDAPPVFEGVEAVNAGEIAVWDLSTGAMTHHWIVPPTINPTAYGMAWIDARHLLVGLYLIDLDYGIPVAQYITGLAYNQTAQIGGRYISTPDGRPVWEADTLTLVDPLEPSVKESLPSWPPETSGAMVPGTKLAVEVDTGDAERDRIATERLTKFFEMHNYDVDSSGLWKVRVKASVSESSSDMQVSGGGPLSIGGKTIHTPVVAGEIHVVEPGGTVVENLQTLQFFPMSGSKYYTDTTEAAFDSTENYFFYGKDPAKAMTEEVWELWLAKLPQERIPTAAVKTANGYEKLPLLRTGLQNSTIPAVGHGSSVLDPKLHFYPED